MLLLVRPSAFKLFCSAAVITFCVVFFFNFHIWGLSDRKILNPFHESTKNCNPESLLTVPIKAPVAPVTVTVTQTSLAATKAPLATTIPEKIWYKLGPKGLSDQSREWTDTCTKKNPTYRYEFLTDLSSDSYVKENFAFRPDIVEIYLALPIPILKADLLRYLILIAEGGIWSDLDVSCHDIPMRDWVPVQYKEDASLVVGLEFDWAWEDDNFLHCQFASWTIMAKPGSTHMWMVVEDILEGLRQTTKEHNVTLANLTYDMIPLVVDLTGPKRMTRSIVKSMELMLNGAIDDRNISGLLEPKLMGDILILPGNAFAASQSNYPKNQGPALVTHHYAGTWKNDHGGEELA